MGYEPIRPLEDDYERIPNVEPNDTDVSSTQPVQHIDASGESQESSVDIERSSEPAQDRMDDHESIPNDDVGDIANLVLHVHPDAESEHRALDNWYGSEPAKDTGGDDECIHAGNAGGAHPRDALPNHHDVPDAEDEQKTLKEDFDALLLFVSQTAELNEGQVECTHTPHGIPVAESENLADGIIQHAVGYEAAESDETQADHTRVHHDALGSESEHGACEEAPGSSEISPSSLSLLRLTI